MNSLSRTQKPRAGFTLLEVMVVIVILGVLASLVVPNLLGNKEKADRQKAISDIVALENALDMYRLDNGRYPTTEQGLEALIQQPANMADARNYRTGGYIKRLPKDPWGNDYQYLSPGEKGLFDVYTLGADGQELSLDVTREMALVFLFSEFASSCASSRLNDTLSTARRLRAASDWVLNVAMVVLPTTQLTVLPGVKVKPSLDSPLQVAPVTRWLPPRVR